MTSRTLEILMALVEGPLHGYGIKASVERRTEGSVRLGSGTLYEAIHRLVDRGEIREVAPPIHETPSGGPPRRFYELTDQGRAALAAEVDRLEGLVRHARGLDLLRG